jgi:hypothetical protein
MSIKLQGSVAFEPEFVGQLSMIARALLEAGLDPAAFTITKHGAQADSPEIGAFQYDYTVSTGEEQFCVTAPNDPRFLDDLLARLHHSAAAHQAGEPPAQGLFARVARWMAPSQ